MSIKNFNRLNDLYFKYLLGSEQRKNLTLSFLNSILANGKPRFTDITFLNKDEEPDKYLGKLSKLDVKGKLNDGSLIDIEMQVFPYPGMAERSLYYWSRMYGGELSEGSEYETLKPAIVIVIVNFDALPAEKDWHNVYRVLNEKAPHKMLSNHLEIHYVELPKLKISDVKKLKSGECWAAYLGGKYTKEDTDMLAVTDPAIIEALKAEKYFVGDDKYREFYEEREKAIKDYYSFLSAARKEGQAAGIAAGIEKGIEKGKEQGIAEGKKEFGRQVALELLQEKMPLATVAKISKLAIAEIKKLAKENNVAIN